MKWRLEPAQGEVPVPGEWADRGACRGWPTAWWYPDGQWIGSRNDAANAVRICRELCPVTQDCLEHALRHGEPGIWGGLKEADRRAMTGRARRRRAS